MLTPTPSPVISAAGGPQTILEERCLGLVCYLLEAVAALTFLVMVQADSESCTREGTEPRALAMDSSPSVSASGPEVHVLGDPCMKGVAEKESSVLLFGMVQLP